MSLKEKTFKVIENFLEEQGFFKNQDYLKIKKECFDDFVIEKIGEDEFSMAFYYKHPSGDLMREPEITFLIKECNDKKCFIPLSYTFDSMGIYTKMNYKNLEITKTQILFDDFIGNINTFKAVIYNLKEFTNYLKNLDLNNCEIIKN